MFGRKKKEGTTATATKADDKDAANKNKPEESPVTDNKKKASPAPKKATPDKGASRRTVAKPDTTDVVQKHSQILYRLNHAVKQRPMQPSRSTELVPLNKEFEDLRKQLRALLAAVKKYHAALQTVSTCRQEVITHTAKLATDTPLADAVASIKVVLGESMVTHQGKLEAATNQAAAQYQTAVVDYVTEWEAILTKKIETEVKYTQKLHKNLKHYETKVDKLRKAVATKEEKGKPVKPDEMEKLQRNETKLKESWEEYETTATQTVHLLDEASRQGWKDLHPLLKKMLTAEYQGQVDLHGVWNLTSNIQDKVANVVDKYDAPLPASAFSAEIVLTTSGHGNKAGAGGGDSSNDLDLSDQEEEEDLD